MDVGGDVDGLNEATMLLGMWETLGDDVRCVGDEVGAVMWLMNVDYTCSDVRL